MSQADVDKFIEFFDKKIEKGGSVIQISLLKYIQQLSSTFQNRGTMMLKKYVDIFNRELKKNWDNIAKLFSKY